MTLSLDIVAPTGVVFSERGFDRVVVRRREPDHVPGSEIAICPHHGPLLMQTQRCTIRLVSGAYARTIDAEPGVLEALDDHITLAIT